MLKEWLDDFYDILFNYRKGLLRIAQNRNIWSGMVIYLLVNLVVSIATVYSSSVVIKDSYFPPEISAYFPLQAAIGVLHLLPWATILVQLVFGPLYFLLVVSLVHLVSELFGGQGGVSKLGAVLGYSHYPYLIVALGGLFTRFTAFNVMSILALAAFLWSLFLKIAGLKIVSDFSWGRATLVYFMPLIAVAAAILLFLLLSIVFLFPLLMQFMDSFPPSLAF